MSSEDGPEKSGGGSAVPPEPSRGQEMSSRLFQRLRSSGVTGKRLNESGGLSPEMTAVVAASKPPDFGEGGQEGPQRFFAGKRVEQKPGSPRASPRKTLRETREPLTESIHGGWVTVIRMMDDVGWGPVMDRVDDFVRSLTLTELAEQFKDPRIELIEEVIAFWEAQEVPEDTLLTARLKTHEDAAAAFCAYVASFQKAKG